MHVSLSLSPSPSDQVTYIIINHYFIYINIYLSLFLSVCVEVLVIMDICTPQTKNRGVPSKVWD